ncbi:MAG: cytochrome c biogenesis protein CcdA [Mycobacteriaceae bacterium]|nr:cytochrome c biogenesis protein CcdA [Mycobacteriaceae bacterium]
MDENLAGLAFAAGLVAALNPCGFAMLPAYLTLVVRGDGNTGQLAAVGRALAATAAMAVGFLAVFSVFGLLAVSVASTVQQCAPYVTVVIGIGLVLLGIWLLAGRKLAGLNPFSHGHRWEPTTRIVSMFGYGVGYATASLSCTVGPFLAVTGATFRGGPILGALLIYLAYGAGIVLIVGVLAVAIAFARSTLVERVRGMVAYTNVVSGTLLVLVGLYVGYYGVYEVRLFHANGNPQDPVVAAAGRVQGLVAGWVHQHGAWPWLLVLAGVVAVWGGVTVWRVRRRRTSRSAAQMPQAPVPVPSRPRASA